MLSFQPSEKLEKALKKLNGLMAETYMELKSFSKEEARYLNHCALISNIGSSTRIENAVLTDHEVEWVDTALSEDGKTTAFEDKKEYIFDKLSKDRERSIEEVVGAREVLTRIYIQAKDFYPLTETTVKGLHFELLKNYQASKQPIGDYKKAANKVVSINHETKEQRTVLDPCQPGSLTASAMSDLVKWYNQAIKEETWSSLVAIEFVFRFLAIHPFQDGNGRLARALFILCLLQADDKYLNEVAKYIAIDRHIEQNKSIYYKVLSQSSEGKFHQDPSKYDYDSLSWFFVKVLEDSLMDIAFYRKRFANINNLSETASKILDCFKASPEKRLKVSDIVSMTQLNRRTAQEAIKKLIEYEFLHKLGKGAGVRYQLVF